jgi:hypothetical protein
LKQLIHFVKQSSLLIASLTMLASLGASTIPAHAATSTNTKFTRCSVKSKNPSTTTKTEAIGFKTITNDDPALAIGQTKTIQTGHEGKRLITYTPKYNKGKLVGCKHTGTKVTLSPQNSIIGSGTYVAPKVTAPAPQAVAPTPTPAPTPKPASYCTNGAYTNSAGNTVCSPEPAPSPPVGATARCVDGTYSFSQSRSGTCSHHGGVSEWL